MADRDSLLMYRDAAWQCNDAAQNVLAAFSCENPFPTEEAKAGFFISWTAALEKAVDEQQAAGGIARMASGARVFDAVKDVVGLAATPILVGRLSFLTAHEAAGFYAGMVCDYLTGKRPDLPTSADLHAQIEKEFMQAIKTLGLPGNVENPPEAPADEMPEVKPVVASKQVQLFGPGEQPKVRDKKKPILTAARYNVVQALIESGDAGLRKDALSHESGHSDALGVLKRLAESDRDWKAVICFPGKHGQGKGYRIR